MPSVFKGHVLMMHCLRWDDATIAERYSGEAGEEWKERLSAKVESREYVPGAKPAPSNTAAAPQSTSASTTGVPLTSTRTESPAPTSTSGKVKVDDKYFAGLGAANAHRPADLPPSQGGKYAGFGSAGPEPERNNGGAGLPGVDEFQKDPLAALGKGFGWFSGVVGKTAKSVNDGYIQPTARQVRRPSYAHIASGTAWDDSGFCDYTLLINTEPTGSRIRLCKTGVSRCICSRQKRLAGSTFRCRELQQVRRGPG